MNENQKTLGSLPGLGKALKSLAWLAISKIGLNRDTSLSKILLPFVPSRGEIAIFMGVAKVGTRNFQIR